MWLYHSRTPSVASSSAQQQSHGSRRRVPQSPTPRTKHSREDQLVQTRIARTSDPPKTNLLRKQSRFSACRPPNYSRKWITVYSKRGCGSLLRIRSASDEVISELLPDVWLHTHRANDGSLGAEESPPATCSHFCTVASVNFLLYVGLGASVAVPHTSVLRRFTCKQFPFVAPFSRKQAAIFNNHKRK